MSNKKKNDTQHFLKAINERIPEHFANAKISSEKPSKMWEIEHVYGYSGDKNKSSLVFGQNNNEILFIAAAIVVKQDLLTNHQTYFGGLEMKKEQDKYAPNWNCH